MNADEIVIIVVFCLTLMGMAATAIVLALFRMRHQHPTLKRELLRHDNMGRPMLDVVVGKAAADRYRRKLVDRAAASGQPGWESSWFHAKKGDKRMSLVKMHRDIAAIAEGD